MGDLFFESFGAGEGLPPPKISVESVHGLPVMFGSARKASGESVRYAVLRCESMASAVKSEAVRSALRQVFRRFAVSATSSVPKRLLILCLGNGDIGADSVGAETSRLLAAGEVGECYTAVVKTGVPLSTGYHSAQIGAAMAKELNADLAVCVDSLAADSTDSLCRMIQVTDSGVSPGSGVSRHGEELSHASLGVPVISIGIPTVTRGPCGRIITLAGVEEEARCGGALIAHALNGYMGEGEV